MITTETLPCDVLPVTGGVLVIPHVLPIHVPADALTLTVAEWLDLPAESSPSRPEAVPVPALSS